MVLRQVHGREKVVLLTARSEAKYRRCQASILTNGSI